MGIEDKIFKHEDSPNRTTGKRLPDKFPVIELKPGERLLYDIESGYPYKVTEEYYQSYMKMLREVAPRLREGKNFGTVFVSGTTSKQDTNEDLKKLFYNPESYNIVPYYEERKEPIGIFIPSYSREESDNIRRDWKLPEAGESKGLVGTGDGEVPTE